MSIIGGLDVHRAQITDDWWTAAAARPTGAASRRRPGRACGPGWASCPATRARSRWRGAPAGGLWSRSCRRPGWSRTWPSRPRPRACAAQAARQDRSHRRAAAARAAGAGPARPARGSRRRGSWTCAPPCGCASGWSTSAPPSSSASTPPCSTTGCPAPPRNCCQGRSAPGWSGRRCRRPAGSCLGSRSARSMGWMPSWTRSTGGCAPWLAASRAAARSCPPLRDRCHHRPTILAELGDVRRFGGGDQVVRATGLDITVYASDGKRSPGHLSRQGPEVLRWALFEAAKAAARPAPRITAATSGSRPARAATALPWRWRVSSPAGCGTPW
jgi:Transposase IS116/IS110/IS902 family